MRFRMLHIQMLAAMLRRFLVLLLQAASAQQTKQLDEQLFGGQKIEPNEFQWVCAVRSRDDGDFVCSGSLIGSRFVLTAHHCVEKYTSSSILIEAGYLCRNRDNCLRENSFRGVSRWYQHEGGGDMALLVLDRAVSIDVKPAVPYLGASFHPKQTFHRKKQGITMEMVGGGGTGSSDTSSSVKKLEVEYLAPRDCRRQMGDASLITDFVICSIPANGNSCGGDSGSALVVPGKKRFAGRDVVMAVHNLGPRNCDDAANSTLVHFRVEDAADLLREVICEGEFEPEDWCPNAPASSPSPGVMCDVESPEKEEGLLPIKALRGTILLTLTGHNKSISADGIAFNSDGSRLLSSSWDGSNKLWNPVGGGEALATFVNGASRVNAGRFHPHGNFFASGTSDGKVQLWETTLADNPIHVFEGHSTPVLSVSWSPCGTKLASASGDGSVKVWNIVTRALITTLTGHANDVESVAFDPEGTQLASASHDRTIKLWNATTDSFDLVQTLNNHRGWVNSVSFSPDGKFLASAAGDRTAKVWDVKTGEVLHDFREPKADVFAVAWSPDGRLVATASEEKMVRVWDARNGGPSLLKLRHDESVFGLDWSPDGTLLASGLFPSGDIIVWRIRREQ